MALEVSPVVFGIGTEADCNESDAEWDATDCEDCDGLVEVTGTGSVFAGGDELVSGRVS